MGRPLRAIRPQKLVEITCRTVQGRFLLRPSPELNRRIVGVLGRAQRLTGLKLHAVVVASNHYHLLASPAHPKQLVDFLRHVQSNVAREAGDLHDWPGKFWARRYRDIAVSDEPEAQVGRLRYCLAHGVKEGLVTRCRDWPGVHSASALLNGTPLTGIWYDRTALYEARRRDPTRSLSDFATVETVELSPLPCWRHLPADEVRRRLARLVEDIEEEHRLDRAAKQTRVTGVRGVLRRHPHERPKRLERTPAPRFHAATQEAWLALRERAQIFGEAFRSATERLRAGNLAPGFPEGSFPPNLPYVPLLAPGQVSKPPALAFAYVPRRLDLPEAAAMDGSGVAGSSARAAVFAGLKRVGKTKVASRLRRVIMTGGRPISSPDVPALGRVSELPPKFPAPRSGTSVGHLGRSTSVAEVVVRRAQIAAGSCCPRCNLRAVRL